MDDSVYFFSYEVKYWDDSISRSAKGLVTGTSIKEVINKLFDYYDIDTIEDISIHSSNVSEPFEFSDYNNDAEVILSNFMED